MAVDVTPLDELVEDILDRRGVTPAKLGTAFCESGHRVISAKLMKEHRLDLSADEARYVDAPTYRRWMSTPIHADDVLLTSEAPLGEVAYVQRDVDWCLGQRLFCIRTDKRKLHGRFLYYCLRGEPARADLLARATGTTVQGIRQSELRRVGIPVRPLPEQKRIAHILGTLDDKIELNRRMNATLESMSRAMFKSWFVDFDPVRQKAAGKQPVGMDAHTAALFPDSFEDSEIGEVPKGWRVAPLPEIVEVNPARSLKKGASALYLDMANAPTAGHTPAELVTRRFGSGTKFMNGDTLVARITPCLENGKTAFIDCLRSDEVAWGSTEFIVLRPYPPLPPEFAYCLARDDGFREFAIQSMTGSSGRQRVPAESLAHFRLACPPARVAGAFAERAQPYFRRIRASSDESRALAALRDTLLPKLLSGEIRVPEAEEAVEETDPVIQQLHDIRHAISDRFAGDIDAIARDAAQRLAESGRPVRVRTEPETSPNVAEEPR